MDTKDVLLVTGASSGFGRLIAETFARKGYTVFASMRHLEGRNAAAGEGLRALADAETLSLHVIDLDVSDEESVNSAVRAVIERVGRIDILVNNAGFGYIGLNETATLEDVQRQFDTNLFGVVRMNRAVLPHMRQQERGLIIYVSSGAGRIVVPFLGLYCASKFALEALAESYHYQLTGLGIDSVIVQPSQYATSVGSNGVQPSDPARAAGYGEIATQVDQAGAAFLASFSAPGCPDPQELVDAVAEVVARPSGTRPLRLPVGLLRELVESVNQATVQPQAAILEAFGLAALAQRRTRS